MDVPFRVGLEKVLEALVFIAHERPGIQHWRILKVLFYADKCHLNRYGRPVTGDQYFAMKEGPVASNAYDMLKLDDFRLPDEVLDEAAEALVRSQNAKGHHELRAARTPKLDVFSRTDLACLRWAIDTYADMPWEELHRRSHNEPAYKKAARDEPIAVEDLIDVDTPNRDELIEHLREVGEAIEF